MSRTSGGRRRETEGDAPPSAGREIGGHHGWRRGAGVEDKSRWVDTIEDALLAGEIDLAVHSAKDVPGELAEGLELMGTPRERPPRMCCAARAALEQLPAGARVGTSSVRRAAQLLAAREDLEVVAVRGNVDTRLRKLGEGGFDAIVLARAGLQRLGREAEIAAVLDPARFVPSPGQGTLALEGRAEDEATRAAVQAITDTKTFACLQAERALAHALGPAAIPRSARTPTTTAAAACTCAPGSAFPTAPPGSAMSCWGASTTPRRSAAAWRRGSSAQAPESC